MFKLNVQHCPGGQGRLGQQQPGLEQLVVVVACIEAVPSFEAAVFLPA